MRTAQVKWIKLNDWYNHFQEVKLLNPEAESLVMETDGKIENLSWEQICQWYQQGHTDRELSTVFNVTLKKVLSVKQNKMHHLFLAI